jgi:hypothetical protein
LAKGGWGIFAFEFAIFFWIDRSGAALDFNTADRWLPAEPVNGTVAR